MAEKVIKPFKSFFSEVFVLNKLKEENEMRGRSEFCDLILECKDGEEIPVHSVIVAAASEFFKNALTSGMQETYSGRIELHHIEATILQKIISFIYVGDLEVDNIAEVEEIIKLAVYIQLESLTEACAEVLEVIIGDGTCLRFWRLAENLFLNKLRDSCVDYIVGCANDLFRNSSFLNELTIEEMKILLADDRLPLHDQPEFLFKCIMKWAENKSENSNGCSETEIISELVDFIPFSSMRKDFLAVDVMENKNLLEDKKISRKLNDCAENIWQKECDVKSNPVLTKSKSVFGLFDNSIFKFLVEGEPTAGIREPIVKSNPVLTKTKSVFGLFDNSMFKFSVEGEATAFQDFPVNKKMYGYTTLENNLLFICGGCISGEPSKSCEYFSPITKEWRNFPHNMKYTRDFHACIHMSNQIIACGGYLNDKTVSIFDFEKGGWNPGPTMNEGRLAFGLTSVDNVLHAVLGHSSKTIEMLDPRSPDGWTTIYDDNSINSLEFNPSYVRCVSFDNEIYGFTDTKDFVFDVRMNKILKTEAVSGNRFNFDVCKIGEEFCCVNIRRSRGNDEVNFVLSNFNGQKSVEKTSVIPQKGSNLPVIFALYH